jgi:hypothetical protein
MIFEAPGKAAAAMIWAKGVTERSLTLNTDATSPKHE